MQQKCMFTLQFSRDCFRNHKIATLNVLVTQDRWVVASIGNGSCANLRLDWKISLLCQHGSVVAEVEEYGDVIEHMMTSGGPLFDRNELIQQILIIFTKELCVFK